MKGKEEYMPRVVFVPVILMLLAACGAPPYVFEPVEFEASGLYPSPEKPEPEKIAEKLAQKQELTIDDVLFLTEVYNPDLEAARLEVGVKGAEAWDAGLYPNPVFGFEVEEAPISGGSLSDSKRLAGFRQDLPLFGRLGAARRLKEMEREAAIEGFRETRRRTLTKAKIAFYAYLAAERKLELLKENAKIADTFYDLVRQKFENRAAPEAELLKAAIERALVRQEVRGAERAIEARRKELVALIGRDNLPFDRITGKLHEKFETVSEDALKGELLAGHPALLQARKEARAAELGIELAKKEAWPDIGFGIRGGEGAEWDSLVEFGIEIPLPLFNWNQARIHAAELRARQARRKVESVRRQLLASLARAYVDYRTAQERVQTYRKEILPKTEKALRQSDEGYRAGEFSFLAVLDAQRTLAETRLAFQAALQDLAVAAAVIEELIGRRLKPVE